jgi:hypothetical protein
MYNAHWFAQLCLLSIHISVAKKALFIHCSALCYHYRHYLVCQRGNGSRGKGDSQQDLPEYKGASHAYGQCLGGPLTHELH